MTTSKRIYYINSRNRIGGTDSDFTYNIDMKGLHEPTHVALLRAYIPKSYYSIQSGSNTLTLDEDGTTEIITLPEGNYSVNSLKTKLKALLDTASPNGWTYTITTPSTTSQPQTGKLTFSVSGNSSVQPSLVFEDGLYEQLGFEANSTNDFVADSLVSTNVINLQAEQTLFIHSDIIQDTDNVLQEIYASNQLSYSAIVFENNNTKDYSKPLVSKTNNTYRFYLTDENSNKIDLNGLNLVMTLMIYQEINWRNVIQSFFSLLAR